MTVLDLLIRDPRFSAITLVEPDVFRSHNAERHLFPPSSVEKKKADLARRWIADRRPDIVVHEIICDLQDPILARRIDESVQRCDIGVCAADNEPAKFHFDMLMRKYQKPWTLGEVLSGGIGGFIHWFIPGGPCYGCVASFLRRSVTVEVSKAPDYSAPGGPALETTIPASRTSIEVIAALHAQITLQLLTEGAAYAPGFTSLLFALERVPGIFDEAFHSHRFRIARNPACLICGDTRPPENVDQALKDALNRLNQS